LFNQGAVDAALAQIDGQGQAHRASAHNQNILLIHWQSTRLHWYDERMQAMGKALKRLMVCYQGRIELIFQILHHLVARQNLGHAGIGLTPFPDGRKKFAVLQLNAIHGIQRPG